MEIRKNAARWRDLTPTGGLGGERGQGTTVEVAYRLVQHLDRGRHGR